MKLFVLVFARDEKCVRDKIVELEQLKLPYLIVCGKPVHHPNVAFRKPRGKYDAINFGARFLPENLDVVILNDVDTKVHRLSHALDHFADPRTSLVFVKTIVKEGPQTVFYLLEDSLRRRLLLAAEGELMLIRHSLFRELLPVDPCKAEDTYLLFKTLRLRHRVVFCENSYVETHRTKKVEEEELYKRRTVAGIYQALRYTMPPLRIRLFYLLLPFISPLLLVLGMRGYYWMRGIALGLVDYLRGDTSGSWEPYL